jgi:hypothetical protein
MAAGSPATPAATPAATSAGFAPSARMPNAHDLPSPDAAAAAAAAALAQHGVPFQQGVTFQVTFQGDEGGGGASFAATSHNSSVRAGGGAGATDGGGAAASTPGTTAQAHATANTNGTTDAGAPPVAPRPVPEQVQQHAAAGPQFTCFTGTQVQILTPEACWNKGSTRKRRGR